MSCLASCQLDSLAGSLSSTMEPRCQKRLRYLGSALCNSAAAAAPPAPVASPPPPGEGFGTIDLRGRVALVTGGGQGLGATIVLALARAGADVAVHYNSSADKAEAGVAAARALGQRASAFQADVGSSEECEALASHVTDTFGHVDILVSNAGMGQGNGIARTSDEEWERTMNVNARATLVLTRCLLPQMMCRRFGRIITVSSNVGVYGRGGASGIAYAASKAALIALTKGIAHEGSPYITCNCVAPGPTDTRLPTERAPGEVIVEAGSTPNALGYVALAGCRSCRVFCRGD